MKRKPLSMRIRKAMRTPNRQHILAITVLLLLVMGAGFLRLYHADKQVGTAGRKIAPQTVSWRADTPSLTTVVYPATNEGNALRQGTAYLQKRVAAIPSFERLILDYLQRKYGLDQQLSAAITPVTDPKPDQQEDKTTFQAFRRFAYPNSLVSKLPESSGDPMTQMMLDAAYCDRTPLPKNFGDLLRQNIAGGRYSLTHVEFSLQRMAENSCEYFSPPESADIKSQVATGMVKLAEDLNTSPDLRYEATAFLLDMGRADLVQQSWIDKLVYEQRGDGGWRQSETIGAGSDHTAMLAIWALLIWTHQPTTNEPMIQHITFSPPGRVRTSGK